MSRRLTAAVIAATTAPVAVAQQTDTTVASDYFVHVGVSRLKLADEGTVSAGGAPLAGAALETKGAYSPHIEGGYFVTDSIALAASVSSPFATDNIAAGSLAGTGNLGTDSFALITGTAQWHFNRSGRVSPYVGAGAAYFLVLDERDGIVDQLEVDSAAGAVLQAGLDVTINRNWGVFFDLKQMFIETDATGFLLGTPISATATLDPIVVSTGLSFRF